MYKYIFCILITIITVNASKELPNYIHAFDSLENDGLNFAIDPKDCTEPGPICDGCDTRFECIAIGVNEYIIIPLGPCPNGTTCSSGVCTANPNPGCHNPPSDGYKFKCFQVGLFPDAFDCQKYHLCVPEDDVEPGTTTPLTPTIESTTTDVPTTVTETTTESDSTTTDISTTQNSADTRTSKIFDKDSESFRAVNSVSHELYCDLDFYFDPRTNLCRKIMVNGTCPSVTGPCNAVGDSGVVASNPALYYVCLNGDPPNDNEIFPQIFVCLNNLEYNVTVKRCLDPSPISGIAPDGQTCLTVGNFADDSDCTKYKECSRVDAVAISRACPTRTYFDDKLLTCVVFTCADVEKRGFGSKVAISNELPFFGSSFEQLSINPVADKLCYRPGLVCKGCSDRVECIEIGGDEYLEIATSSCPTGTTCVNSTGACTANTNPGCTHPEPGGGYKFVCHQIGEFPDPFDCQKSHLCIPKATDEEPDKSIREVEPDSIENICTGDFYYDPRTTLCRKKLINGTCPDVTGPCNAVGDVGVFASNPALYYICLRGDTDVGEEAGIFPQIFACLQNYEYDASARRCLDPNPVSGVGTDGRCIAEGMFADSSGCSYYRECSAINASAILRSCATRTYFKPMVSACVEYTCADVDK